MKITLNKGRTASAIDINSLESLIGETLPISYLEFVQTFDGARPETNILAIDGSNDCGVNAFIPVQQVLVERQYIEGLSPSMFPVAWAEGGNYVVVDGLCGAVFFWDHEQSSLIRIADDFAVFLEMLKPFSIDSICLNQDQVIRAWIDPEFLAMVQRRQGDDSDHSRLLPNDGE